jgi:catalase
VPVTVWFPDVASVPTVAAGDPLASPRGMAIEVHLPAGNVTDIVAHSYKGFPTRTADEFLEFVRALAISRPGVPSPKPIETFIARHPQVRRLCLARKVH